MRERSYLLGNFFWLERQIDSIIWFGARRIYIIKYPTCDSERSSLMEFTGINRRVFIRNIYVFMDVEGRDLEMEFSTSLFPWFRACSSDSQLLIHTEQKGLISIAPRIRLQEELNILKLWGVTRSHASTIRAISLFIWPFQVSTLDHYRKFFHRFLWKA